MSASVLSAVSFFLPMAFAAVLGAHLFYATVIFPVSASDLPKSFVEWIATPYAKRVHPFFGLVVSALYSFASIAVVVAVITGPRMRLALLVAALAG